MAGHVYWRLNFSAGNGANIGVAEVTMSTSQGGASVIGGGAAGGSNINTSFPAANAFDGNPATDCQLTAQSGVIYYGFPTQEAIVQYTVQASASLAASAAPNTWTFEYSDDGVNYTVAARVTGQTAWNVGEVRTFYATAPNASRSGAANPAAISVAPVAAVGARRLGNHTWGGRVFSPAGPDVRVSGTVSVLGTATAGLLVRAYRKTDGVMMGQAYTDNAGHYSIECGGASDVYVLAFDPVTYQAVVFDEVIPA